MARAHLIIEGRVQNVGYRWFVRNYAKDLEITGIARNLPDGTVEVIAEGYEGNLNKLIELCREGPLHCYVKGISIRIEVPLGEFKSFEII